MKHKIIGIYRDGNSSVDLYYKGELPTKPDKEPDFIHELGNSHYYYWFEEMVMMDTEVEVDGTRVVDTNGPAILVICEHTGFIKFDYLQSTPDKDTDGETIYDFNADYDYKVVSEAYLEWQANKEIEAAMREHVEIQQTG